jgi:LysM repeat protein
MMNAVAAGGSKKKEVLSHPKDTLEREELTRNVTALRKDVNNLISDVRRLQKGVELLKSQGDLLSATQTVQVRKVAEEVYKRQDIMGIVNQEVNALSLAFSQKINTFSEEVSNAFNAIISVINAQQKLSNVVTGSETKQSEGSVYEVKAGETLDSIAMKFKMTKEDIRKRNFIPDENYLPTGLILFIPQTPPSSLIK